MLARNSGCGISGIAGYAVWLRWMYRAGVPAFEMVGLRMRRSKRRANACPRLQLAIGVSARRAMTSTLPPADVRKGRTAVRPALALGILAATGQVDAEGAAIRVHWRTFTQRGDPPGRRRIAYGHRSAQTRGPAIPAARSKRTGSRVCGGLKIYPVHAAQVVDFLNGNVQIAPQPQAHWKRKPRNRRALRIAQIKGQAAPNAPWNCGCRRAQCC